MDVNVWKPERAEGPLPVVYLNVFQGDGAPVWEACQEAGCPPFALVAVGGLDWNRDLSPWGCEATTRSDEPFAGGAREHLEKLLSEVIPQAENGLPWPVAWRGIAGYSLAGLFALWSLWETPAFSRVASVSGSLWFPGLLDWCTGRPLAASPDAAYLSLGKREHKTPNRMMRGVLDATRGFEALLRERGVETTLELNPGNHFCEPDARTARGIAWLLRA
ncbi:alpha/beta hydrolase [uncultured Parolsenella sp.]|uniref:alpha/beta hydrolase n=1 Tax=uncultured Parolsenella sp. TaxID=2083008 RepID=UPI00259A521B|nr:alpha/beta hydrolase-fold protein [uncultured Parolsenella sp.]